MISCHWVLWSRRSGTSVCRFKSVPTWWLQGLIKRMRGTHSYWMKPYLVVKISSDIVTEHCCQVCVLSMMFCRSVAVCWHGKWLRNQQETPRSTNVDLNCGRPPWDIKKLKKYYLHLIFTFCVVRDTSVLELFHVVSQQKRFAVFAQAIESSL